MFNLSYTFPAISFSFPDVCDTPIAGVPVPLPYPDFGLGSLVNIITTAIWVFMGFTPANNSASEGVMTIGNQAGIEGGITCMPIDMGPFYHTSCSTSTCVGCLPVVRMVDATLQNMWNSVGMTISPSQFTTMVLR